MAKKKTNSQAVEMSTEIINEKVEETPKIVSKIPMCMLNVRKEPRIESDVVRVLSPNDIIEIEGDDVDGFAKLVSGGYAMSMYLSDK